MTSTPPPPVVDGYGEGTSAASPNAAGESTPSPVRERGRAAVGSSNGEARPPRDGEARGSSERLDWWG